MIGKNSISIWFFIDSLLLLYGVIILVANIYDMADPSAFRHVMLQEYNFGVWWGILLTIIGLVYFIAFRPWKKQQ